MELELTCVNKNLELESQTITTITLYFIVLGRKAWAHISIIVFEHYHFISKHVPLSSAYLWWMLDQKRDGERLKH